MPFVGTADELAETFGELPGAGISGGVPWLGGRRA